MKNNIQKSLKLLAASLLVANSVHAATFDFKDPKGVNHVIFKSDAPLEFISGTGKGLSGKTDFDPAAPEGLTGTIRLAADSLVVPNDTMLKHLRGGDWLNVEKFPEIVYNISSFAVEKTAGNVFHGTLHGEMTMRGVTKPVKAAVKLTHVPNGASQRGGGKSGDLLVARADFSVSLSEFGIDLNAAQKLKVSDMVELEVVIAGYEE